MPALQVKVFTRRHLVECAKLAHMWGFNRQLSDRVAELPEANYPVALTLLHRHRQGQPCEPHMRCRVLGPGERTLAYVDVPLDYYQRLPSEVIEVLDARAA
jgi:hypothetical protein